MHRLLIFVLSLFLLIPSAQATDKPNLVLLPIDVSEQDAELETEYGASLQEGLQQRYVVYFGPAVEKQLEKEYSKIDCDTETCNQNLAIAFNGELIADGAVKRIKGGYLLKLVVRNVLTGEVVETQTSPCRDCDSFTVISRLKMLGRGSSNASADIVERDSPRSNTGSEAILIIESQPSGANIFINGKASGKTPYQGLKHQMGENLLVELKHSSYRPHSMEVELEQQITHLKPIPLEKNQGKILISVEPFKAGTLIYVNGQKKGNAPLSLTLNTGEHRVKAIYKGGESKTAMLRVVDENNAPFVIDLGMRKGKKQTVELFGNKFEFIEIPAGTFQMGSNKGDDDERPIHIVNVGSFQMMTTEVTQRQWFSVMGNFPSAFNWTHDAPVEQVSWNEIQNFIKKLNSESGKKYRLPSEAEWEYAAKAGAKTLYSWGDELGSNQANCKDCNKLNYKSTVRVKKFEPNAFGLYDMLGNVWEWTQDCWNDTYNGAPQDGQPWREGDCNISVLRGGAWDTPSGTLSMTHRRGGWNDESYNSYGFRVVQDL